MSRTNSNYVNKTFYKNLENAFNMHMYITLRVHQSLNALVIVVSPCKCVSIDMISLIDNGTFVDLEGIGTSIFISTTCPAAWTNTTH